MAASTITRDTWTNDTGSVTTPVGDGTLINNSALQNNIYARIDEMFSGAGSYATLTVGGIFSAEGFGTHSFSGGGTAANSLLIRNTTAGTGNFARLQIRADAATLFSLNYYSSTFTSSGFQQASGAAMVTDGAGGISIVASSVSAGVRFYTGGVAKTAEITSAGGLQISDGSASAPSIAFVSEAGTGFYRFGASHVRLSGNSVAAYYWIGSATVTSFGLIDRDLGAGNVGPGVTIGRNSNASPVAGNIVLTRNSSAADYVWSDASGNLRIGTSANVVADTGGTVVGTQTSARDTKDISGPFTDTRGALALMRRTGLHRFTYKSGAYNRTEFMGIVADDSPEFAMDEGRSFNPVSAFGYTVAAIQEMARRLDALEAA